MEEFLTFLINWEAVNFTTCWAPMPDVPHKVPETNWQKVVKKDSIQFNSDLFKNPKYMFQINICYWKYCLYSLIPHFRIHLQHWSDKRHDESDWMHSFVFGFLYDFYFLFLYDFYFFIIAVLQCSVNFPL